MELIDLTMQIADKGEENRVATCRERRIRVPGDAKSPYRGLVYQFDFDSMSGTYIDFPGHIAAFDDGRDAANCPPAGLYQVPAAVIRPDRGNRPRRITAEELNTAAPEIPDGGALVINALGAKDFHQVPENSVYLSRGAARRIAESGVRLVVSDAYENHEAPEGVFVELFRAGVAAVCHPVNLRRITTDRVRITALPLRMKGVTQLPCRLVAVQ